MWEKANDDSPLVNQFQQSENVAIPDNVLSEVDEFISGNVTANVSKRSNILPFSKATSIPFVKWASVAAVILIAFGIGFMLNNSPQIETKTNATVLQVPSFYTSQISKDNYHRFQYDQRSQSTSIIRLKTWREGN